MKIKKEKEKTPSRLNSPGTQKYPPLPPFPPLMFSSQHRKLRFSCSIDQHCVSFEYRSDHSILFWRIFSAHHITAGLLVRFLANGSFFYNIGDAERVCVFKAALCQVVRNLALELKRFFYALVVEHRPTDTPHTPWERSTGLQLSASITMNTHHQNVG